MKFRLAVFLFLLSVFYGCGHHCNCSGPNSVIPDLTAEESSYIPALESYDTLYFKNNLNIADTFIVRNYPKAITEPECGSPSLGCCICPIDNYVDYSLSFINILSQIKVELQISKDQHSSNKSFTIREKQHFAYSSSNLPPITDTMTVNGNFYNDVYTITLDSTNTDFINASCKIWKYSFSKANGLIRYHGLNGQLWNRVN